MHWKIFQKPLNGLTVMIFSLNKCLKLLNKINEKRLSECVVVGVDSRQIQWQESAGHQEITSERSRGQQRSSHLL